MVTTMNNESTNVTPIEAGKRRSPRSVGVMASPGRKFGPYEEMILLGPEDDHPEFWVTSTKVYHWNRTQQVYEELASRMEVIGYATHKGEECRIIRAARVSSKKHKPTVFMVPVSLSSAELGSYLQSRGMYVNIESGMRAKLNKYLIAMDLELEEFRVTSRPGWHGGTYVFGDGTLNLKADSTPTNAEEAKVIYTGTPQLKENYHAQKGTQEDWIKYVAPLLKGNPFLMFAAGASLTAPLLDVLGVNGFGIHFYGSSSAGKTTAMRVANSIWGNPQARINTWDATPHALTIACYQHNGALLSLDELKQATGKDIGRHIYGMGNGTGRLQGTVDGNLREVAEWNTLIFSTGEMTVEAHVRIHAGIELNAGALVRILNITYASPTVLHGYANGAAHAEAIKSATEKFHGAIGRHWVKFIVQRQQEFRELFDDVSSQWREFLSKHEGAGQVMRVADYFAAIETALLMAGPILKWSDAECKHAVKAAFFAWLGDFTSNASMPREHAQLLRRAINVMTAKEGQFTQLVVDPRGGKTVSDSSRMPADSIGYVEPASEFGRQYFYVHPSKFIEHIAGEMNPKVAARILAEHGFLMVLEEKGCRRFAYRNCFFSGKKLVSYKMCIPDDFNVYSLEDADE